MRSLQVLVLAGMLAAFGSPAAVAQEGPGGAINPNKDCRTILRCNFAREGRYRGCVSAYRCRTCRFVKANCSIGPGNTGRTCRELRCSW